MSAYVVNDKTINVIASGFVDLNVEYRNQAEKIKDASFGGVFLMLMKSGRLSPPT